MRGAGVVMVFALVLAQRTAHAGHGVTAGAGIGVGGGIEHGEPYAPFLAADAFAGGWITPRLVIGGRLTAMTFSFTTYDYSARVLPLVVGPALQYWLTDRVWLGGGVGVFLGLRDESPGGLRVYRGPAADLRIGVLLVERGADAVDISLGIMPTYASDLITIAGLLVGYQRL